MVHYATHLVFLAVLDAGLVRVVLQHSFTVCLFKPLITYAIPVLLETQDFVVSQLRDKLRCKVVTQAEVYIFAGFLWM